ncbi:sensor histidine kinase [Planosporangium mesophilum]|uniref:histidine kinase n=1 Tax=Planosporangium mesophilum TaxID=689768 RepID=A0A8J3T939_9ACTN|nr:sensor histidine kinase [Planosporangium mesophilum]NJC83075.1 sensor histidine kinase [Planosporangium mesophilum]GII22483.1 two-component sensor histidine kinase [Planosporangium mesophilum]
MTARQAPRTYLRRHPLLADALLAALLYAGVAALWLLRPGNSWPAPLPAGLLWSALAMATITLRRRATMLAVGLLTAHTLVSLLVPRLLQVEAVGIVVLTYTAAAWLPLRRAVLAAGLLWTPPLVFGLFLLDTRLPPMQLAPPYFIVFATMAVLLCVTAGRTVHHRRAYVAALTERARDAERNQQALTAQAVADERRRIARELHDMVAHHVSVMGVLATGSRRALHRDPAAADEALATIEETGRTALREMRRLLDVLRTDQEPAGELAPQPGMAHLAGLVEQVSEAGLPVTLTMTGDARTLDPGVALTIYRIVQEALTNALKHAGSATAEVRLDVGTYWLTLEICDTGRGPRPGGERVGHGLLGMRERVTLYGGTLRTGPRPGGGFRVSARIPVDALDGAAQ